TVDQLEAAVYNHTLDVLDALQQENITPKWVQIGNETNNGMLWEHGKASETNGFENYATFVNAGMRAVKHSNEKIGTVLHLGTGTDNDLCTWNIDGLIDNGIQIEDLDVIGLSLYPDATNWMESVDVLIENIKQLKARYGKEVLVAEVGFDVFNTQLSYQLLRYLIEKIKLANALGVFYWEPIAYPGWKSYYKGAWNSDGSPSPALEAFIDNLSTFEIPFKIKPLDLGYPTIETTSDTLLIAPNDRIDSSFYVYNTLGVLLFKLKNNFSNMVVDISHLPSGLYVLKSNKGFSEFFQKVKD
ncbi:MAG: glycosyl hydrolase 53 family protein, partial [Flavicella sp.]